MSHHQKQIRLPRPSWPCGEYDNEPRHPDSRDWWAFFILAAIAIALALASGCGRAALSGGGGKINTTNDGFGPVFNMEFTAPENPNTPSQQSQEASETTTYELPAGSVVMLPSAQPEVPMVRQATWPTGGQKASPVSAPKNAFVVLDRPMAVTTTRHRKADQSVGSSWRNTAMEVKAKMQAALPILGVGAFFLLLAVAFFYFGKNIVSAGVCAGIGFLTIMLYYVVPGNEKAIIFGGVGLVLVVLAALWIGYYRRAVDRDGNGVPDRLEKKPAQ